ncbi:MAG: ROK family transcriptional regulator [Spirochaetes bacterium]|nr:ROK family transcriptional regulator [Spirochaetota bacterium]
MSVVLGKYKRVLQHIQENSPVDKSGIASALGISLMTVNKIVNRLLEKSIIVQCGKQEGGSGRRSDLFKFNPDLFLSIGLDIDEERIMLGAVDSDGVPISQQEYTYERDQDRPGSAENIIMGIEKYSSDFMKQNNLLPEAVAAIGVAPHGIIDTENGRCLLGTHLGGIIDLNLREELESVFGVPVYVNDPARALAYYERKYGHGREVDNFIYIFMDKGVGSGIVIDGKIHLGASGMAGEIGHLIVAENGERCKCGNYGCLETVASVGSIIRQVKKGIQDGVMTKILDFCDGSVDNLDLSVLKEAADNNDKFALNILDSIGSNLGKAVSVLINLFNPELILLGGQGAVLGQHLLQPVLRVMQRYSLNLIHKSVLIKIVEHDRFRDSVSIAVEAFDKLFNGTDQVILQRGAEGGGSEGSDTPTFLDKLLHDIVPV